MIETPRWSHRGTRVFQATVILSFIVVGTKISQPDLAPRTQPSPLCLALRLNTASATVVLPCHFPSNGCKFTLFKAPFAAQAFDVMSFKDSSPVVYRCGFIRCSQRQPTSLTGQRTCNFRPYLALALHPRLSQG